MGTTANYGLNKPTGSDLVNPLTDTFPNWDIVDGAMHDNQVHSIGVCTEIVSANNHALTRVSNTDARVIRFIATANFEAGDTFTLDGVSINAYSIDGQALTDDCYIAGSVVMASLNADDSALFFYVQAAQAQAADSERLGGELPSYYATKSYADGIKTTADNAALLIGRKSLVNTYYDNVTGKLYEVNADGSQGGEIEMGTPAYKYNAPLHNFTSGNLSFTTTKECYLVGSIKRGTTVTIDGTPLDTVKANISGYSVYNDFEVSIPDRKIPAGKVVTVNSACEHLYILDTV